MSSQKGYHFSTVQIVNAIPGQKSVGATPHKDEGSSWAKSRQQRYNKSNAMCLGKNMSPTRAKKVKHFA